ncbi:MFS transporter (plasmid) [Paracoccus denitrificans]|uniref:cyclophilin-like fold protein n=1 Tax=Paracoccus denitrificans TaxID=266 RepID=UPI001E2E9639|nr:cyclophilin-like fold protein [Paracoccus denitrificans]UFS68256.1 MFS transporter [Paracoccus denitrificans]
MTDEPAGLSRRSLLAAAAASLALPAIARAQEGSVMRIRFVFADQDFTATLEDNPSARDLLSMLPLDLAITDYSTNEKIAYLPRKLTEEGSGPFGNEAPGDLCYYAPWGNLALFHASYRWSRGLIPLGRLNGGPAPLLLRGAYPLRVEPLA